MNTTSLHNSLKQVSSRYGVQQAEIQIRVEEIDLTNFQKKFRIGISKMMDVNGFVAQMQSIVSELVVDYPNAKISVFEGTTPVWVKPAQVQISVEFSMLFKKLKYLLIC